MDGDERSAELRVSDPDREAAVARLRERAADGTLTLEEFLGRMERAFSARTRADLARLEADLPRPGAAGGTAPEAALRRRSRRWFVGILAGARATGRWRCGARVAAITVMGGCELDLRHALIEATEVTITAVAVMGGIQIVVPEGVEVELTGIPVLGGKTLDVAPGPPVPGGPRIVVRAFPVLGGVEVRSRA